jgi:hypothetical protein
VFIFIHRLTLGVVKLDLEGKSSFFCCVSRANNKEKKQTEPMTVQQGISNEIVGGANFCLAFYYQ